MTFESARIGFLGAGRMATALAAGFCRELVDSSRIVAVDPVEAARSSFASAVGEQATVGDDPGKLLAEVDILILAVKPQILIPALNQLSPVIAERHLLVSIAAGITIESMEAALPANTRLVRVMPNTPCLVGKGACGISPGSHATGEDLEMVSTLLQTVGLVEQVPEKLLDAVTGVSGSGPAYVFQMIEALSDGGVRAGLPRDVATRLAAQTLAGAAEMVLQTNQHPGALKDAVTSPGGTTIAAIHELERAGLRAALMNAVEAAVLRSQELGQ